LALRLPGIERREDGPAGVIFIQHWCTEQGHGVVAAIVDDAAPVALYTGLGAGEERLHEVMR